MVTTQAIKGGFELRIGVGEGSTAKLNSSQVSALLDKMRASPGYSADFLGLGDGPCGGAFRT